ncbi:MAG: hypothetical protein EAY75_13355 [Bacteroidetes bacterium]|nr:MAG: hypothetical protein EAY75_13355 [Bacteroidota bacterium]
MLLLRCCHPLLRCVQLTGGRFGATIVFAAAAEGLLKGLACELPQMGPIELLQPKGSGMDDGTADPQGR